jgi:hypothetical protein
VRPPGETLRSGEAEVETAETANPTAENFFLVKTALSNKLVVISIPYRACLIYKELAQVPVVACILFV